MSDPLSLALAIAPLALEALKRFRALNSKLRTFSHYSQEIKRVQTRFEVQRDFFQSECELLLRKVTTSQSQVEAFLTARQFDAGCRDTLKRLCAYLGSRQTAFQGTFEDIKASLHDLEAELQSFEQFDSKRQDGESLKGAVKRLRRRLKVTVNKTSYDEALERLKESNYDLKGIRKHAQELRDNSCMEQAGGNTRALPLECRQFSRVRLAALAFHEAMVTRWVCEERKHQRHLIRLLINAEVQRDVRMKFFLLGEWKLSGAVGLKRPDLICLEVRSAPIECSTDNREKRTQSSEETIDSRVTKRRRVRWAEEISTSTIAQTHLERSSHSHSLVHHKGVNVGSQAECYQCTDMPGCVLGTRRPRDLVCLGHFKVEMEEEFRHSFYSWSGICSKSMMVADDVTTAKPLANLFNRPVHENFDILDQLLLAKTMVATILKFHSTPWLGNWWTLNDIHYLDEHGGMEGILGTVHLGAVMEKGQKQACEQAEVLSSTRQVTNSSERSQRIRNTVLHNLGVGLIQIDRWTNLDPNAINDIEKLATQRSRFGPKYRDLVQKCLYCDFGVGANLLKPQLQTAILDKVMRELESMISGLRIDDDDAGLE